jgi:hypothetical protein
MGVAVLPQEAFGTTQFATDWIDTTESQRLVHYHRHTLDDYVQDMRAQSGYKRLGIRLFRPLVRYLLLKQSTYYHAGRVSWMTLVMHGFKALKGKPVRIRAQ